MLPRTTATVLLGAALAMLAARVAAQPPPPEPPRAQRQPPPPVPAGEARAERREGREGGEPIVHGPVHEAFAAPTPRELAPPQTVSELPPEPPEELPPAVAPQQEGDAARWIPGYWGWDSRDEGYVWVSGTWRSAPPEMEWIPGYWDKSGGECRWVAGFWAHGDEEELAYLPQPPAPKVEQPPPPPDDGHFWISGNWQYAEEEYRWKPGFWAESREDWIWTPDCYTWSPRGHIFVRGYWDLPLERRGMLFAPLAMKQGVVRRVSPTVVIDVREALVHWFVAPTYRHYCFGDYYTADRRAGGIVSWYDNETAGQYDAVRSYYSGHEAEFFGSLKAKHKRSKQNAAYRPALDWRDYDDGQSGGLAYAISGGRLPAGIARFDFAGQEFAAVTDHYRGVLDRRSQFEREEVIAQGQAPVFVQLDTFVPPGHGGLPPGLAKKGLVPPGFGGAPPGQSKKVIESFGPIYEKPPKKKEGGKGGGKGKGKGK